MAVFRLIHCLGFGPEPIVEERLRTAHPNHRSFERKGEMNKGILNKLYWGFWFSTTVLTGIMAGFMISHSIMFGRFLSWFVESDNLDLLRRTRDLLGGQHLHAH
jgi:hypothetical protein